MNFIPLLIGVIVGAFALLVWHDPKSARTLSDKLYARSSALRASREAYTREYPVALDRAARRQA